MLLSRPQIAIANQMAAFAPQSLPAIFQDHETDRLANRPWKDRRNVTGSDQARISDPCEQPLQRGHSARPDEVGARAVSRFSIERMVEETESLYYRLLNAKRKHAEEPEVARL